MIHVYDEAGSVIETHEHAGDFRFHTRGCEWKAEAKMIILIAWTTYAAGMGLL